MTTLRGNIVDIHHRKIYFGELRIAEGRIQSIEAVEGSNDRYILPGFVDAHVHIESSMLVPSEFARLAVVHGTVATVSDPHEIANVLGSPGVHYMINNGQQVPFKFNFGAPSCVPATTFETAGARIDVEEIRELLALHDIRYLAEMMNYPGVLFRDPEVMAKIAAAQAAGKVIDGHAPGLRGEEARQYIAAGISTDHECFSYEEGLEKIQLGMKILIREGSAAKNFDALIHLLPQYPDRILFCSDDKHPDDLILGHINQLVGRALREGCELFDTLRAACLNPVEHYGLDVGLLRVGDPADFIVVGELEEFTVQATYIDGQLVAEGGATLIERVPAEVVNNFHCRPKAVGDFALPAHGEQIQVIKALDGEIVTESFVAAARIVGGKALSDTERDILKMTVVNRYTDQPPALAFIHNFGLKQGAIASCVGHDSHNIIALGVDDEAICQAVNLVVKHKGGISAVSKEREIVLPLPVAGIMSNEDGYLIARQYAEIDAMVKSELGCTLTSPFMTLSFMALLVIPELKLSDQGLFDGKAFAFRPIFT
ncbi:MAG: adenine deaminase [Bacteroidota bacterium]